MSVQNGHDNSIRRYLLGDLSDQERERIEQLLMSDDALYEQLVFTEDDLIDEYIFGTLPDEDRSKFQRRFLHVPELRQSVNFTAALREHALQTAPKGVVAEPAPSRPSLFDSLRNFFMQPAIGVAVAGVLLGAIALNVWLIRQNSQLRSRVGQLESQQTTPSVADLQQRLDSALKENKELSDRLQQQQPNQNDSGRPQVVQDQPKGPTQGTNESGGTAIFAVTLTSGVVRDSGEGTKRVTLPANTRSVKFQLDVAPGEYQSYGAVLQTPGEQRKWSNKGLKITTGNFVPFEVPARVLVSGDYEIVLTGLKSSGASDPVANYYFRIQK